MDDQSQQNVPGGFQAFPQGPYPYPAGRYPIDLTPVNTPASPWPNAYISQASVGAEEEDENIVTKKVGGLPVWMWAVGAAVLGIGGYLIYQKHTEAERAGLRANRDDDDDDGDDDRLRRNRGWSPSRSAFADKISSFLKNNGIRGVKVYADADEAARTIKNPSPLITLRTPRATALHTNAQFVALCKGEGLKPVETTDGIVGLYPDKGPKAKQWEQYIDDLRDEGQKV